jgi:beta-glucanase (GH16 family)
LSGGGLRESRDAEILVGTGRQFRQEDLMKPITAYAAGILFAAGLTATAPGAETIRQDFTSMADLNAFWSISTWGGDNRTHSAANVTIADGILSLKLSGSQPGQIPVCAEIATKRSDFKYGSYRASIKTSRTAGGVVGWFIYRDSPLNEIDVEMLTKDNSDLHFTLHHIQTSVDYKLVKMAFDPSAAFHEYRFDWYADKVAYFVDGKPTATLTKKIPDLEAAIMLNHWSGNIDGWGGPAPTQDMFMYVDWMIYSTEYPAPTTLQAAQGSKAQIHPGTLAFDGGNLRAVFRDAGDGPARLFTVQGRMTVSDRSLFPNPIR